MEGTPTRESVAAEVLDFYSALPFNIDGSADLQARAIRESNSVESYPDLHRELRKGQRVLDVGCGAGWLSNRIAHHYGASVLGIDFNPVAVGRAAEVARKLRNGARFEVHDLFRFEPEPRFDVVVSIGVLHHTHDCLGAVRHLARSCLARDGLLYLGLYHGPGREPFLSHFEKLRASGADEDALLAEYLRLHRGLRDDTHARSWFRDQVLHPHETQHTLREVAACLGELGLEVQSTSINAFAPIRSLEALFAQEEKLRERGRAALQEGRYFPGFFTVAARAGRGAQNIG